MRKRNYAKVDRSTKTGRMKKLLFAAMIPVGAYFLVTFVFGEMGLVKYYRMKAQYQALTQEIAELKQDNIRLMREVRALKTDPVGRSAPSRPIPCISKSSREINWALPGTARSCIIMMTLIPNLKLQIPNNIEIRNISFRWRLPFGISHFLCLTALSI